MKHKKLKGVFHPRDPSHDVRKYSESVSLKLRYNYNNISARVCRLRVHWNLVKNRWSISPFDPNRPEYRFRFEERILKFSFKSSNRSHLASSCEHWVKPWWMYIHWIYIYMRKTTAGTEGPLLRTLMGFHSNRKHNIASCLRVCEVYRPSGSRDLQAVGTRTGSLCRSVCICTRIQFHYK